MKEVIINVAYFYNELAKLILFGLVFFNISINVKRGADRLLWLVGSLTLGIVAGAADDDLINIIIRGILLVIAVKLVTGSIKTRYIVLAYVVISLVDSLAMYLLMMLFGYSSGDIMNNDLLNLMTNGISTAVLLVAWMIKKFKHLKSFELEIKGMVVAVLLISAVTSGLVIAYIERSSISGAQGLEYLKGGAVILLSVMFYASQCFGFFFKSQNERLSADIEKREQLLLSQKKYYTELLQKDEQVRRFRHDFRGHMGCINALVEDENYSGLKDYVKSLSGEIESKSLESVTGNHVVNAIVSDIKSQYPEVAINWKGKLPSEVNVNDMDMCVIFYNLLNNACREVSKQDSPSVDVCVKIFNSNLFISVNNVIVNNVLIKDNRRVIKHFEENHGYGLRNVEDAVSKYNGDFSINGDDGRFNVDISLLNVI